MPEIILNQPRVRPLYSFLLWRRYATAVDMGMVRPQKAARCRCRAKTPRAPERTPKKTPSPLRLLEIGYISHHANNQKPETEKLLKPLTPRLAPLTPSDIKTLSALAEEMTDRLGRTISAAAIVRALIRLAGNGQVTGDAIAEQVEQELQAGRMWGMKPR